MAVGNKEGSGGGLREVMVVRGATGGRIGEVGARDSCLHVEALVAGVSA